MTLAFAKPSLKDMVMQGNLKKSAFPVLFQWMLILLGKILGPLPLTD